MDGSKVIALSAAAVTLYAAYRIRENTSSTRRIAVDVKAGKRGKAPSTPTPSTILSPAVVPTLQKPPPATEQKNTDSTSASLSTTASPKEEAREPETPIDAKPKKSLKPRKAVVPLDLTTESHVEKIDCETLASWLTNGEHPVLVDVRNDDFKGGNIAGARHLPYTLYRTGQEYVEVLTPEANQRIVFVCLYGKEQSPSVAHKFLAACEPDKLPLVHVLHGGFQAWLRYCARADLLTFIADYDRDLWVAQDGGLVYRPDLEEAPPGLLRAPSLRHMRMQTSALRLNLNENHRFELVECAALDDLLASDDKPLLVDVRADDYKGGNIPGSINIPFDNFTARAGEVVAALRGQNAKSVVFLCMYGMERSPTCAMTFLTTYPGAASKVYVLRKGFQNWVNYCLTSNSESLEVQPHQVVNYDAEKWVKQGPMYLYAGDLPI